LISLRTTTSKDGDHTYGAYIYWGSPAGYSVEHRTHLPTMGTHNSMGISPGNIYDRRPEYDYISPAVRVPRGASRLMLEWTGETPHKTSIRFEVRAAADEAGLAGAAWLPVRRGESCLLPGRANFLQYRAILVSPDGGNSPLLREVTLAFQ
jgi:hypothetical protein